MSNRDPKEDPLGAFKALLIWAPLGTLLWIAAIYCAVIFLRG